MREPLYGFYILGKHIEARIEKRIDSGFKTQKIGGQRLDTKEDLHLFVSNALNSPSQTTGEFVFNQPNIDYSKWGPTKEEKLSKFQKSSLANLHTSWINIPHVTQHDQTR